MCARGPRARPTIKGRAIDWSRSALCGQEVLGGLYVEVGGAAGVAHVDVSHHVLREIAGVGGEADA